MHPIAQRSRRSVLELAGGLAALLACDRGASRTTAAAGPVAAAPDGDTRPGASPAVAPAPAPAAAGDGADASALAEPPRWVDPPAETNESRALIQRAADSLRTGAADVEAVLGDPAYLPVHPHTAFRRLIRRHARAASVSLAPDAEPGPRIRVEGTLRDGKGSPLAGVEVYAYQTDARGWYAAEAPHFSGHGGDEAHARLFAYLRTDAAGSYTLRSIRPSGYPRSDLPAHIHIEVFLGDRAVLVSEVLFADDPRLTPAARARGAQSGFQVAEPTPDDGGVTRYRADFVVSQRP